MILNFSVTSCFLLLLASSGFLRVVSHREEHAGRWLELGQPQLIGNKGLYRHVILSERLHYFKIFCKSAVLYLWFKCQKNISFKITWPPQNQHFLKVYSNFGIFNETRQNSTSILVFWIFHSFEYTWRYQGWKAHLNSFLKTAAKSVCGTLSGCKSEE